VREFVGIADDIDRANPPLFDIERGGLEALVGIIADVTRQAVDDGGTDDYRPMLVLA
jgi:hypothetical protein